jgi:hypothetical protein
MENQVQINWGILPTVITHLFFILPFSYVLPRSKILYIDAAILSAAFLQSLLYHTFQFLAFGSTSFLTAQVSDLCTAQFLFVLVAATLWRFQSYAQRASFLSFAFVFQANLYLFAPAIAIYITLPAAVLMAAIAVILFRSDLVLPLVAAGTISAIVACVFIEMYNPNEYGDTHSGWHILAVIAVYCYQLSARKRHDADLEKIDAVYVY